MAPKNEVAKVAESPLAIMQSSGDEIKTMISGNLGGGQVSLYDLETVRNPGKGQTNWTVPGLEGDELKKELVGIIIGRRTRRSYFMASYDDAGEGSPDCISSDGIKGKAQTDDGPGGTCESCPLNQWESASKGAGKACAEKLDLVILGEDDLLPYVVTLPSTSLKSFSRFMLRLSKARKPYFGVMTAISLEVKQLKSGQSTSEAQFRVERILEADEADRVSAYTTSLQEVVKL